MGQEAQVAALLEPIYQDARRVAYRLATRSGDADDILQDAVITAIEQFSKLRDPAKFRAWFFQILLSRARDRYRTSIWRRSVPMEDLTPADEPVGDDGLAWEPQRAAQRRLVAALQTLNADYREAVVLADIDEMSIEEIANVQKSSPATVKSRLARGRAQLRSYYLGLEPDAEAVVGAKLGQDPGHAKRRLALAAVVLLLLLIAGCLAIARFVLHVDFSKSDSTLQDEVSAQLRANGVASPLVEVMRNPGQATVSILSAKDDIGDFQVAANPPKGMSLFDVRIHRKPGFELVAQDMPIMQQAIRNIDPSLGRRRGESDDMYGARIAQYAASVGFEVEVSFVEEKIIVVVAGRTAHWAPTQKLKDGE